MRLVKTKASLDASPHNVVGRSGYQRTSFIGAGCERSKELDLYLIHSLILKLRHSNGGIILYQELQNHIEINGYNFKAEKLTLDNSLHSLKEGNFKGWYWGSINETSKGHKYVTLTYYHYQEGVKHFVRTDTGKISKEELSRIEARQRQEQEALQRELEEQKEAIAKRAREEFNELTTASTISRYCKDKKIGEWIKDGSLLGAKVVPDGSLIVPMKDINGKFWGYQTIDAGGQKLYLPGQKTDGCFFRFGKLNPKEVVYICEGFATGVSIYAATGKTTVVAFSAGGLISVSQAFRNDYQSLRIVLCGDEDVWNLGRGGRPYHTGRRAAKTAASRVQGSICQVSFRDLNADTFQRTRPTDFNDLHVLCGLDRVAEQIGEHYETSPHEYIPTEHTGFHERVEVQRGPDRWEPRPADLQQFFQRSNNYVVMNESEGVYIYRDGVYKPAVDLDLASYSQKNFILDEQEVCTNYLAREFEGIVKRKNNRPVEWFQESIDGFTNFKNGILHLESGEFLPHTQERGFRHQLPYNYDEKATAPHFEQFLEDITLARGDMAQPILEYIGYTVANCKPWACAAMFLLGEGSNGKSTLLDVMAKLLGEENCAAVPVGKLNKEYDVQTLDGKMANLVAENDKKGLFETEAFKAAVSGDNMSARAPYEKPYNIRNRAKFYIAMNSMPQVTDPTDGFWRRMIAMPFNAKFSNELGNMDPHIDEKLAAELPGIYNLAVKAYRNLRKRKKFDLPKECIDLLGQIRKDSDPVEQFLEEVGLVPWDGVPINGATPPKWGEKEGDAPCVKVPEIYAEYTAWSDRNRFHAFNSVHFGRRALAVLRRTGKSTAKVESKKMSRGGKKFNVWVGVDWRGASEI